MLGIQSYYGYGTLASNIKFFFVLSFQDQYSSSSFFFLNFASSCKADGKEMLNLPRSWASLLRQYSLWIVDRRKSSPHLYMPQELFLNGNWLVLCIMQC